MDAGAEKIEKRIQVLQSKLQAQEIDLAVIIANADLYYFSGTIQAEYLLVPCRGAPVLAVRRGRRRSRQESPLTQIVTLRSSSQLPQILAEAGISKYQTLGCELDVVAYNKVRKLQRLLQVKQKDIANITGLIRQVRMVKSEAEISLLKQAAAQLQMIPELVKKNLQQSTTELELSAAIEAELRASGHQGIIRMRGLNNELPLGVCTAGENAVTPVKSDALCGGKGVTAAFGAGASSEIIEPGVPIALDFVSNYQGYYADQTRLAVLGEPGSYLTDLYEKMHTFLTRLSQYLTPDYSWEQVYQQGQKLARELGVRDYYLGVEQNSVKFVGHGVGLELNEFPFLAPGFDNQLKPGMTIALEPKLLVPEVGMIGLENSYLVTNSSPERLTTCSEELIVVS